MRRPSVLLPLAFAAALPTLLAASCKKDEEEEETEEPTPVEVEPDTPTAQPEPAPVAPPVVEPATPTPTPTPPTTPQPTVPKPTTADAGVKDAGVTKDASTPPPDKSRQCSEKCQAMLQTCLIPKPGEVPDSAKCQSAFESCRSACF